MAARAALLRCFGADRAQRFPALRLRQRRAFARRHLAVLCVLLQRRRSNVSKSCRSALTGHRLVSQAASLEVAFNAVERVEECVVSPPGLADQSRRFCHIEQEPTDGEIPPPSWPGTGDFVIDNLSLRYAPTLPLALDGVTLRIPGGKRTAIAGRTGSGKSSLMSALLRFVEPTDGRIYLGGVDISSVQLRALRSQLVVVSQGALRFLRCAGADVADAVLASGTVRSTLDPTGEHDDATLNAILAEVHLDRGQLSRTGSEATLMSRSSSTSSLARRGLTLDDTITAGGLSLSQGERQCASCSTRVCADRPGMALARGLLQLKTRSICLLDEASASLDAHTDAIIQAALRRATVGKTVITIAHRLESIIHSDLVVVLGHGSVLETGSPAELLLDDRSAFAALCRQSGDFDALVERVRHPLD